MEGAIPSFASAQLAALVQRVRELPRQRSRRRGRYGTWDARSNYNGDGAIMKLAK